MHLYPAGMNTTKVSSEEGEMLPFLWNSRLGKKNQRILIKIQIALASEYRRWELGRLGKVPVGSAWWVEIVHAGILVTVRIKNTLANAIQR